MNSGYKLRLATELLFLVYLIYTTISINFGIYFQYLSPFLLFLTAIASTLLGIRKWISSPVLVLIFMVGISAILIQYFAFGLDFNSKYVGIYYTWIIVAIIVFPLANDERFIRRVAFVIALSIIVQLPFLTASGGDIYRIRLIGGSTGFDNANDLAAWTGFSFIIFWMSFWKERKNRYKLVYFFLAASMLIVALLTVSRGSLVAIGLAIIITMRGLLPKNRLHYIAIITIILAIFFVIPLAQEITQKYQARLFEDTGRFSLLQGGWNMLISGPFWGYGGDNIMILIRTDQFNSPHNPFILIGLTSGLIPLILFIGLWLLIIKKTIVKRYTNNLRLDNLALMAYVFTACFLSNGMFVSIWAVASVFYASQSASKGLKVHM